jgi:hypothetical protein
LNSMCFIHGFITIVGQFLLLKKTHQFWFLLKFGITDSSLEHFDFQDFSIFKFFFKKERLILKET